MSDPELYARTLLNAASGKPDFYICMGDDFSVDAFPTVNADTVAERYALQRPFPRTGRANPRRSFWSMETTNRHRCSISTSPTFAMTSRSGPKMPATVIFPCPLPMAFTPATRSR